MDGLVSFQLKGRWHLGDRLGHYVGSLVWLQSEEHVVRLVAGDDASTVGDCWRVSEAVAPWYRYVVGAPKKKTSRRGAHRVAGAASFTAAASSAAVHARSDRSDAGVPAAASSPGPDDGCELQEAAAAATVAPKKTCRLFLTLLMR